MELLYLKRRLGVPHVREDDEQVADRDEGLLLEHVALADRHHVLADQHEVVDPLLQLLDGGRRGVSVQVLLCPGPVMVDSN